MIETRMPRGPVRTAVRFPGRAPGEWFQFRVFLYEKRTVTIRTVTMIATMAITATFLLSSDGGSS